MVRESGLQTRLLLSSRMAPMNRILKHILGTKTGRAERGSALRPIIASKDPTMIASMRGMMSSNSTKRRRRDRSPRRFELNPCGGSLDRLEVRMMPAVVFAPQFGTENVIQNHGAHLGDNPVYLIFRGSHWNSTNEGAYIQATQNLVAPSNRHFDVIKQYGTDGNLSYGGSFTNGTDPGDANHDVIQGTIENVEGLVGPTGQGPPIFVVVTWNVGDSDDYSAGGYNFKFGGNAVAGIWDGCGASWNNKSVSSTSLDPFTNFLSHELGEIMTDFGDGGIKVSAGASWTGAVGSQIGDNEGNSYVYKGADNVQVQPLWSDADKAWVASDASSQTGIVLLPNWNAASFTNTYRLAIFGDGYSERSNRFGGTVDDRLSIQSVGGNLVVTLNGEQAQFPAYTITSVYVALGTGQNSLQVLSLPAGMTLTDSAMNMYYLGNDAVTLGSGGSLGGIQGTVNLNLEYSGSTLTLDDSADKSFATFGVTSNSLVFNGRAILTYTVTPNSRTILGGPGGSTFDVNDNLYGSPITLKTGTGTNQINIHAATSPVSVSSSSGTDNVLVGADGSLAGITAPVSVSNNSGHDAITVNDSANTAHDSFAVANNSIQSGGRTVVTYSETSYAPTVTINGGSGGNTVNVNSTAAGSLVVVNTGAGLNNVNLHATSGPVSVVNQMGSNQVNVGDWSLVSIGGPVTISNSNNSGYTDVFINDQNDPTSRFFDINAGGVSASGLATINLQGGIRHTYITSGSAANVFEVDAPPPGTVTLFTNYSDYVFGAASSLVNRSHKQFFMGTNY